MSTSKDDPVGANDMHDLIRGIDERITRRAKAVEEIQRTVWPVLAGDAFRELLASPAAAIKGLSHNVPRVRIAALSILTHYFEVSATFMEDCEQMSQADSDSHVRLHAAICLAHCYMRQQDSRAIQLLASLVRDETQSDDVRVSCYALLCGIDVSGDLRPAVTFAEIDWDAMHKIGQIKGCQEPKIAPRRP